MVANLLRPQNDFVFIARQICHQRLQGIRAQRKSRCGDHIQLARLNHLEHAILQDFSIRRQSFKTALAQFIEHCIRDIADARLERQQVRRQPAFFNLVLQELHNVPGNRT